MLYIHDYNGSKYMILSKKDENKWELFIISSSLEINLLHKNSPLLIDKHGIQDLIRLFQDLLENKPEKEKKYFVTTLLNDNNIKFSANYVECGWDIGLNVSDVYDITFTYQKKISTPKKKLESTNLTIENNRFGFITQKKSIQKYINDLEKEIGEPITNWEEFEKEGK